MSPHLNALSVLIALKLRSTSERCSRVMAVGSAAPVAMPVRLATVLSEAADAGAAATRSAAIEAIRTRCALGMGVGMLRLYQTEWCPHSTRCASA